MAYSKARIDNGEPLLCEFEITHEAINVDSRGPRPDPNWSTVDAAGHFHAYDQGNGEVGHYPTLRTESAHVPCDGSCGGVCEGEGYDVTYYLCRICGVRVEPGLVQGPHSVTMPGRISWAAIVYGVDNIAEQVTVRISTDAAEYFGVGQVDAFSYGFGDGMRVEIVGVSPLGRRKPQTPNPAPSDASRSGAAPRPTPTG